MRAIEFLAVGEREIALFGNSLNHGLLDVDDPMKPCEQKRRPTECRPVVANAVCWHSLVSLLKLS